MLATAQADELATEAAQRGLPPGQLALEKGLLSPAQIDIISVLLSPLESVPGYEILDILGRGGMGVVYRARQRNLDRVVALKTVLVHHLADGSSLLRFEREAQAVGRLTHPHIVAAYDFGKQSGRLYLAMELVPGRDLDSWLTEQHRLSEPLAWSLARQAAAGLAHAAKAGIVHRDVKPANLLLVDPPEGFPLPTGVPMVKITDFGLAMLTQGLGPDQRLTLGSTTLGSPHYMAPEQFEAAEVDHRADIYALGVTVYQMLLGRPPFQAGSLAQLMFLKLRGKLPLPQADDPQLSPESWRLLESMLASDPQRRIGDYETLMRAMEPLMPPLCGDTAPSMARPINLANAPTWSHHWDPTRSMAALPRNTPAQRDDQALNPTLPQMPSSPGLAAAAALGPTYRAPATESFSTKGTVESEAISPRTVPATSVAESTTSATQVPFRKPGRHGLWWAAAVVALALSIGVGYWAWSNLHRQVPPPPVLAGTGWFRELFDGRSLAGWQPLEGGWSDSTDSEGGFVLAGQGRIRRPWPEPEDHRLTTYRLSVNVDRGSAKALEVQFALESAGGANPPRFALRLEPDRAQLGHRQNDLSPLKTVAELPLATDLPPGANTTGDSRSPEYRELRIEHFGPYWWAWYEDQLIGGIYSAREVRSEFRLRVEGGRALFEGPAITELRPPTSEPTQAATD